MKFLKHTIIKKSFLNFTNVLLDTEEIMSNKMYS